jgi:hypothetical protein
MTDCETPQERGSRMLRDYGYGKTDDAAVAKAQGLRRGGAVKGEKGMDRPDRRARGGATGKHGKPVVNIHINGGGQPGAQDPAAAQQAMQAGRQQGMQIGAKMGAQAAMQHMGGGGGGPPPGAPPPGGMPPGAPPPGGPPMGAKPPGMMARGGEMGDDKTEMIEVAGYKRRRAGGKVG